ncbi:MAG: hypothetical protein E6J34_16355 [Chloroflexi bacterium]|nr:MAG: hypothetical protein E6J34_16355 [Chloroflexota bacterium]
MIQDSPPRLQPPSLRTIVIGLWPSIFLNGILVYGITIVVIAFTIRYGRRLRQRADKMRRRQEQALESQLQ